MVKRYQEPYSLTFKKLGNRIKTIRLKKGVTQEAMINEGFSLRFYQRIEAGKPTTLKTLLKIANIFDLSLSELFKGI